MEGRDKGEGEASVHLNFMGYKYLKKKVSCFVFSKDAGTSIPDPDAPYYTKFLDSFGNIRSKPVMRPKIISQYFDACGVIDSHNQLRQDSLGIETAWATQGGFFRLICTIISMTVTDSFAGAQVWPSW